jgi:hypothetical protein
MLALHVAFTLLGITIFAPLVGLTGQGLLRLSGEPAVADQDIARFLLSPAGLVALIVFAALLIGIVAFEQSSMMRIALGRSRGEPVRVVDGLWFTAVRAHAVFLFAAHLTARFLVIVLPFLSVGAVIAWWLISDYDINYYLADKPREFILAAALIALVLAVMVFVLVRKLVGWSLALPLVLFDSVAPRRSFAESVSLTEGHRLSIFGSLCLWSRASGRRCSRAHRCWRPVAVARCSRAARGAVRSGQPACDDRNVGALRRIVDADLRGSHGACRDGTATGHCRRAPERRIDPEPAGDRAVTGIGRRRSVGRLAARRHPHR